MPTYDYACEGCGGFEAIRSLSVHNEPAACPGCGTPAPRVFATAPRLALLDGVTRTDLEINERARHEPRSSRDDQVGSRFRYAGISVWGIGRPDEVRVVGTLLGPIPELLHAAAGRSKEGFI